uniref:hypothetical protein n=1 Tax=Marinobacterium profundum TaxID=1714300 RepID=UPI00082F145E|nr:hypothetical protein [Marinobacterium profundum]
MAIKPLSASQKKVIRAFAEAVVVAEIDKNVDGCEGFKEHYLRKRPEVAQAERAFQKAVQQVRKEFADQVLPEES